MSNNNYFNPYQQEQAVYGNSYQYAPVNNVEWTQPLTQEEARSLKTTVPAFDILNVSKEEMIKSHCAHRDPVKKELTLVEAGDGSFVCTQCGEQFNIVDISEADAEKYVNGVIDILQTAKTLYVDLPPKTIEAFFQMIPFLKKLPRLYTMAHDTFERVSGSPSVRSAYMSGNPWFTMGQAVAGAYNGMPAYGAPYGYGGYDPNQVPPQGYNPAPVGANPFMGNPNQYANQNNGQGVPFNPTYTQNVPAQTQAAPQPTQNNTGQNNNGAVTTNKQFEV